MKTYGNRIFCGCRDSADKKETVIANDILYDYFGEEAEITISDNVARIDERAFVYQKQLKKVYIPATVKNVHKGAFEDCFQPTVCRLTDEEPQP